MRPAGILPAPNFFNVPSPLFGIFEDYDFSTNQGVDRLQDFVISRPEDLPDIEEAAALIPSASMYYEDPPIVAGSTYNLSPYQHFGVFSNYRLGCYGHAMTFDEVMRWCWGVKSWKVSFSGGNQTTWNENDFIVPAFWVASMEQSPRTRNIVPFTIATLNGTFKNESQYIYPASDDFTYQLLLRISFAPRSPMPRRF